MAQIPDPGFNDTGIIFPESNLSSFQQSGKTIGIAEQADGKILTLMRGNRLWRFNPDGSKDTTFGAGGFIQPLYGYMDAVTQAEIMNVFVTPDQKILVVSHNATFFMFRKFNSDGTADETFGPSGFKSVTFTYPDLNGFTPTLQPILTADQKILFATTAFLNQPETPQNSYSKITVVAKFSLDGTPDLSFNGTGFFVHSGTLKTYAYTGNRIYIYTMGYNLDTFKVSCLNYTTGALDTSFGNNGVIDTYELVIFDLEKMLPFDDGSMWLYIERYNTQNTPTPILKRLTASQQIDNTFGNNGTITLDLYVNAMKRLSNGKILMAGKKGVPGYQDCVVERFNSNGTTDVNGTTPAKYTAGLGPYGASPASCITIANDGKYLIGGGALVYQPGSSNPPYGPVIWRLLTQPLPLGTDDVQSQEFVCYPNPVTQKINIRYKGNNMPENFRLYDMNGRMVKYFTEKEITTAAQTLQLDVPGQMTTGNYILLFSVSGREQQVRIAKQ